MIKNKFNNKIYNIKIYKNKMNNYKVRLLNRNYKVILNK